MNTKPLVSIIIPVFNAEKYLEENIESVLSQTYDNIEILYVCDGCTDNSVGILNRYNKDKRLKIINRDYNIGAAASRNQGAEESHGEWLIFWDSDDLVSNNAIEILVDQAIKYSADLVICSYAIMGEECDERDNWLFSYLKEMIPGYPVFVNDKNIYDLSSMLVCNAPFNKLLSRKLFDSGNVVFQDLKNCNDVFFSAATLLFSGKIVYVDKKIYWYRKNANGNLSSKRERFHSCILEALSLVRETMLELQYSDNIFREYAFCEIQGYKGTEVYHQIINDYNDRYKNRWGITFEDKPLYCLSEKTSIFDKRIVIFGAGQVGRDYYMALKDIAIIVGWIDSKKPSNAIMDINTINDVYFDYVIIATRSELYANQMRQLLLDLHIKDDKIIMEYPRYNLSSIL